MLITSLSHRNAFTRSNLLHTDGFYADMTIVVKKRLKARCRHLCIILGVRHHCRSLHQSRFQHRCQKDSKACCDLLTPQQLSAPVVRPKPLAKGPDWDPTAGSGDVDRGGRLDQNVEQFRKLKFVLVYCYCVINLAHMCPQRATNESIYHVSLI